ncbi:MAG: PD-(D/E)XK nuclease family protein [Candidatus Margulisiibacteriota bacterium]
MDNCITIGLGEDLIKKLAALLIEESKGSPDLSRTLCIFSNRRASLFLIKELSKQLGSSFFPPKMMTDDDLAEEIVRAHTDFSVMPAQESQYIIYNLAKKHAPSLVRKRPAFADFLSWAQEISSFIDQLDMEAVDDKALVELKSHAQIGLLVPDSVNQLLKNIGHIRKELHKEMEKRKQYSRGYIYLKAAELFEEKDIAAYENILICNFFYMQKTEKEIFKKLLKYGKTRLLFQGDAQDWPTLRENAKEFSVEISPTVGADCNPPLLNKNIQLYEAADKHAEAGIVKELMKKTKSSGPETVIVLPEYDALLPVIAQASPYMEGFNISLGYRLTRSSIYYLLMSIFKAQNSRKKNGQYYSKDYLQVLMHPVAKNWEEAVESRSARILVHKIEESLNSLFVSPKEIEEDLAGKTQKEDIVKALVSLHDTLFRNWENIETFSQLASAVSIFLDGAGKLGLLKSHPMNYAVVERLYEKCDEIRNSSFADEVFSKDELMRIFDEMMSSEKVNFLGTPLKGVQVLGLFQTHSISFDNVIILDANEGSLPKVRASEPLIPREAMLMVGLKRLERTEEIEKYQFRRLIASSKNAHIIYCNDDRSERSRFVEELLLEQERASAPACRPGRLQSFSSSALPVLTAAFNMNPIPEKNIIKKTKRQAEFLKKFEYSPTSVNTYLTCPAQFYYSYVLRLREQDDKLEQIEGRDIGTFIHELLEDAYMPFKGQKPLLDKKFSTLLMAALERKFKSEFSRRIRSGDFMLRETLKVAIERFISCERGRDIEEVLELEKEYRTKISVGDTDIVMKGKVDRIDRMLSGEIMVLDYKTGSSDIKPSTKIEVVSGAVGDRSIIRKKIKSLQLPIYLSLVSEKYDLASLNPALYSIKDSELVSLWEDKHDAAQRKELYQGYMSALNFILSEIIDPSKDFEPDESDIRICGNCPFAMMCR